VKTRDRWLTTKPIEIDLSECRDECAGRAVEGKALDKQILAFEEWINKDLQSSRKTANHEQRTAIAKLNH
jgi:hypothetical protein